MIEIRDGKKILVTPVSAEDLKDIRIDDIVYLSGSLTTCRDVAHRRVVEEGRSIPVDVRDCAIFHAGPIIRPLKDGRFEMVSVGPTTSMRMEKFEYEFVRTTGVRVRRHERKRGTGLPGVWRHPLCIPRRKRRGRRGDGGGDCPGGIEGSGHAGNPLELPCQGVRPADRFHRRPGKQLL